MKLKDKITKVLEVDRIHLKLDKDFGSINRWHIVHSERFKLSELSEQIDKECNEALELEKKVKSMENKVILLVGMYIFICLCIVISRRF